MFRLSDEGKGKQTKPDVVLRNVLDDDCVAQLKEVLKVGVGILASQATELACLHHRDEASADLEASIPHIDSGPSRHVGNSGGGVVTEYLGHSDWCWNGYSLNGCVAEEETLLLGILNIITKSRLSFLILITAPKMPNLSLI